MRCILYIIPLITLVCICCSCGGDDGRAMPRRYAYPRVEVLDSVRTHYKIGGADVALSREASVSRPTAEWATVTYERLGATLYLSVTEPADMASALANRRQRISLNIGSATATTHRLHTDGGFDVEIVTVPTGAATPVQFLATDGRRLVSGAFTLAGRTEPADSLRPIVGELEKEAFRMFNVESVKI